MLSGIKENYINTWNEFWKILNAYLWGQFHNVTTLIARFMGPTFTKKSLATLDGEIVDTEIAVKLELRDVLKLHDVQT